MLLYICAQPLLETFAKEIPNLQKFAAHLEREFICSEFIWIFLFPLDLILFTPLFSPSVSISSLATFLKVQFLAHVVIHSRDPQIKHNFLEESGLPLDFETVAFIFHFCYVVLA